MRLTHAFKTDCCALLALAMAPFVAPAENLAALPWIGDGLPDRNGADWYEEDPAPEFMAEFVLPEGVTETKIHFACAGFGWFRVGNKAQMRTDGLDTFWTPYDKTIYSKTAMVKPESRTCVVVVRLGNGFYNMPPLLFWGRRYFRGEVAHGRPCFKLAIDGIEKPLEWKWRRRNFRSF